MANRAPPPPPPPSPVTALYGGSFNPVHLGHLNVARHLLNAGLVARVLFLPAARSPHKPGVAQAGARHRLAMLRLALAAEPGMAVSAWELRRGGVSYTIHAVRHFARRLGAPPVLVLGYDCLAELHRWYEITALLNECRVLLYARPGSLPPVAADLRQRFGEAHAARLLAGIVNGPEMAVSSREVRARLAAGDTLAGLVPAPVASYIAANGLYRPRSGSTREKTDGRGSAAAKSD